MKPWQLCGLAAIVVYLFAVWLMYLVLTAMSESVLYGPM